MNRYMLFSKMLVAAVYFLLSTPSYLQAQSSYTMYIHMNDGAIEEYNVEDIDSITFTPPQEKGILDTNNEQLKDYISEIYDHDGWLKEVIILRMTNQPSQNHLKQIYGYNKNGETVFSLNIGYGNITGLVECFYTWRSPAYFYIEKWPMKDDVSFKVEINNDLTSDLSVHNKIKHALINKGNDNNIKNIAWFGTSIPAGSLDLIGFSGYNVKINRGGWEGYKGVHEIPNNYPSMVASMIGANVYNEAVGSSRIAKARTNESLLLLCKSLSWRVEDILGILTHCYAIDWEKKVYQRNINNKYSVIEFLNDNTWESLMLSFATCISFSYEVCMVSRYLIDDSDEHDRFVKECFGKYYFQLNNNIDIEQLCKFNSGIDVFILDHSMNDYSFSFDGESEDEYTLEGAYNKIVNTIYRYKPDAMIAMVSNYIYGNKFEAQKIIADKMNLPFIDIANELPISNTYEITTQGYWDDRHIWHASGFEWNEEGESYSTNNTLFSGSKDAVLLAYKPEKIDGLWTWKCNNKMIWLYDGLHPHSDKGGRINKMYASVLSVWLNQIMN